MTQTPSAAREELILRELPLCPSPKRLSQKLNVPLGDIISRLKLLRRKHGVQRTAQLALRVCAIEIGAGRVIGISRFPNQRNFSALLGRKQLETVELARLGLNRKEIAERRNVSEETVKRTLHNIYRKLNVSSMAELALLAERYRIHQQ